MNTTSQLTRYELRDAIRPGLFPGTNVAPGWPDVERFRVEHEQALEEVAQAFAVGSALRERFQREDATGRVVTDYAEREQLIHAAAVEEDAARRRAADTVARLVDEAREQLDEWRAVEDNKKAERTAEIASLRARLTELETEDATSQRLNVWLNRLDPDRITPGLITWASLAAIPVPPDRPIGPIARSFQQEEDAT
jgi:hypothetical protein